MEKIIGRATIALNPSDRSNAVIVDLAAAPRDAQGMVEATTDVMILRPGHPNGAILLELPNRGRIELFGAFDDAVEKFRGLPPGASGAPGGPGGSGPVPQAPPAVAPNQPRGFGINTSADVGNGFLLDQGFTLVWVGWQGDVQGAGIIPGARRSFTNARFAQPGRNPQPMSDRLYPVGQFPFTYSTQTDPLTSKRDGLMVRCTASKTCPRIIEMDSEYEFWGSHASLNVESQGKALAVPPNVRFFMMTGAQHSSFGDRVSRPMPGCVLPSTPVRTTPLIRAMVLNLDDWVKSNTLPPASRYPSVIDGTLVSLKDAYPPIPQLPYKQQIGKAFLIDQTADGPVVRGEYQLMVPKAGPDGNAIAGLRLPIIAVPRATYVGWNPEVNSSSPEGLCTQAGGVVPFAATRAKRVVVSDPRPSLEELYPTPDVYVNKVRQVVDQLVAERLMLKVDADAAVEAARQNKLARLSPFANNSGSRQAPQ